MSIASWPGRDYSRCMRFLHLVALSILCAAPAYPADVLVYGATPSGIAAAVSAARDGATVELIEPTERIGGMVTSGLSHTDFRSFEGITGFFLEFTHAVEAHYRDAYGPDSPQAKGNFRGTHAEPKVNLAVFESMLAEHPLIRVRCGWRLTHIERESNKETFVLTGAHFENDEGRAMAIRADCFIDATYEGDLMAAAGVPYRVGREGRDETGESLAPETGDDQLQGYNFRLIATTDPGNRILPAEPPGYKAQDFRPLLPLFEAGKLKSVFVPNSGGIYKAHRPSLPNGKHDINDVSHGIVRLSMPGHNKRWPDGDAGTRVEIFREHLRWNIGLLYFLQNDAFVPETLRDEARKWGWCRDEFVETDHLPPQLYVREARRMQGLHVFSELDCAAAPDSARAVLHRESIAMGDYGLNCHGTGHEGPLIGGRHTGEFYKQVAPYQIPIGTLLPQNVRNLVVPVAASSTHVGFCGLRLEPIWTSMGQAAGHIAATSAREKKSVRHIKAVIIQRRLHELGAASIYISDVLPGHPDFAAVQWWASQGGLHVLGRPDFDYGTRGEHLHGQYFQEFPGHAADLEKVLDPQLAEKWFALAKSVGLPVDQLPKPDSEITRGYWIGTAWRHFNKL